MSKDKDIQSEEQKGSTNSTLNLLTQWINRNKKNKLFRLGSLLAPVAAVALLVGFGIYAIKNFESSWYSFYFSTQTQDTFWIAALISIDIFRWTLLALIIIMGIGLIITPQDTQFFDSLFLSFIKTIVFGLLIFGFLVGFQNLVIYSVAGWKFINIRAVGEGLIVFLAWMAAILIVLGSNFLSRSKTIIFAFAFNFILILFPVTFIITTSSGGFEIFPQWISIVGILFCLYVFILGVDELKGSPSLYTSMITVYRSLEAGHTSLQTFRKRSAEALANALKAYNRMPQEEQEILAKWILENNKPSFFNKFWAITKIVASTIALTILVQEPAIILLKWVLKTLFGFSY